MELVRWSHRIDGILEVTDVANAILDGTDCLILSEESAMGDYPLDAVQMLAKIATVTEPRRLQRHFELVLKPQIKDYKPTTADLIARSIESIAAISTSLKTCRDLMFSYGVYPMFEESNRKTGLPVPGIM